jgi:hypothetical protein
MAMPAEQILAAKDNERSRLPILAVKPPSRTMTLQSRSPTSPTSLHRSKSQNESTPSMRVRFVDSASCISREARDGAIRDIASVQSSCYPSFKQHDYAELDQCSATTSTISGRKPDGICELQRRQTDAATTSRSANGITLRRTSSCGSQRATVNIWEPWQRSSLSQMLVAKGSKTSLSRHHNVPCVEIGTKAQKDDRESGFDMSSDRQRAAIALQPNTSRAQSEGVEFTEPDRVKTNPTRNDSTLPDVRTDSIGDVKTSSAPKVTFDDEHSGSRTNPRDSALPELYSGPSSSFEVANNVGQISCFDWYTRQGSQHDGFPPGENRLHHELSPQELETAANQRAIVTTIEPDQDFTTKLGSRKPRQLTSTPEQMERLRRLWKDKRDKRGLAGQAKTKLRSVLSSIARLMPGSQGQARHASLRATSSEASVPTVGHRGITNDPITNDCSANVLPAPQPPAELEASHLRDFRFPSWDLTEHVQHDQKFVARGPVPRTSMPGNGEVFEMSAEPKVPTANTGFQGASIDKPQARISSLPVSPTTVLFEPTASPLPPISPPHTTLSRAWSVLGTSSTARHELMASPLPPMPPRPQLNPRDRNDGRHALAASPTYHRAGPFIYNEGHMRSLADFSLSEVQRYWLRAQADAQADVMEGWIPWGL